MLVFVLVVTLIPVAVWSSEGIVDPFMHNIVAYGILALHEGAIDIPKSGFQYIPSIGFLIVIFSEMTGIPLEAIQYIPIAALFFVFAAGVFVRRFMRSSVVGSTIASLLVFRWLPPSLSSFWPHTFGFALFFLFVTVYMMLESRRRWELVAVLVLIFFGVHFLSYTVELWLIAFLAGAGLIAFLRAKSRPLISLSLVTAFVATSLAFNEILYAAYIPSVLSASTSLSTGFGVWFSGTVLTPSPVPYVETRPPSPPLLFALNVLYYGLLVAPVVLVVLLRLFRHTSGNLHPDRSGAARFKLSLLLALVVVWIADLASYGALGAFGAGIPRVLFLVIPLVAIWAMEVLSLRLSTEHTRSRWTATIPAYSLVLLLISVAAFPMALPLTGDVVSPSKYVEANPSALWFFSHASGADSIFSDHNTQGQYSIVAAEEGFFFGGENFYNSTSFDHLVNASFASSRDNFFQSDFIVVNLELAGQSTTSAPFVSFEPLQSHLVTISNNLNLVKVYDDGAVWVFEGSG